MSRNFATGGYRADFGAGNTFTAYPTTQGCWVKDHPDLSRLVTALQSTNGDWNNSHFVRSDIDVANRWFGATRDASTQANATAVKDPANTWTPILYVCRSATDRQLYVGDQSSSINTTSKTVPDLRYLGLGADGFTGNFVGLMAEAAYWSAALSAGDVTAFLGGTKPSEINSANLRAYYSLKESSGYLSDESGNVGPTLTVHDTEPTYSAEHPTITSSSAVLDTQPLYYGSVLLDNKTGINWKVSTGHDTTLDGFVIASGSAGTTDGSGIFVPNGTPNLGTAGTDVTLFLYWEEGTSPVVDRSLIVKTTLVAP